ncbi:MAG: DUF72 domain-containing protein [Rhodothermales bacterium]|nr:DUF72 domain-containing protein [Rhodothermales bacterium]
MSAAPTDSLAERLQRFDFRSVHPNARFGTASDRYAGWIGQIYPEHYRNEIRKRKRKLAGKTFEEQSLPIASVEAFFEHYDVLELDFTFYRPLVEGGKPTNNFFVLQEYANNAPDSAIFYLKAPQTTFARSFRRSREGKTFYEPNGAFLNPDLFVEQFHQPARQILGQRLGGFIFEQSYARVAESPTPEENIDELDVFFNAIPRDVQHHLELRSPHLLTPDYFAWLETCGLGFVFSHWTWLPPLRKQWKMCGGVFTADDNRFAVRLLTPLKMPYAQAYAKTFPFDKPVEEIAGSPGAAYMVNDTAALIYQAEKAGKMANIFINNRAWGNGPSLAQALGERIRQEEERRAGRETNE